MAKYIDVPPSKASARQLAKQLKHVNAVSMDARDAGDGAGVWLTGKWRQEICSAQSAKAKPKGKGR